MSTTALPPKMESELSPDQLELQARARGFVENVLMPLELEAEERGGRLPEETVEEIKQAVALANATAFGLTGAIHTYNSNRIEQFIARYRAGLVSINGPTYGAGPHMPFGGVKNSVNGFREPGTEALDVYSEWKTVVVNHDPARV